MGLWLWLYKNFLYVLLGVATIYGGFWLSQHKERLKINGWVAILLAILHTAFGVLAVSLFAFLESGDGGKMSLFGGVFFMPVLYFVGAKLFKRSMADVADVFAITMVFTLMCARVNCLFSGCCLGKLIPGTEIRWPTREAEILFYIVLLIVLMRKVGKSKYAGKIYPIYMMAYGVFRFVVEWFRETGNQVGFFHLSHIWALTSIVIGAVIYKNLSLRSKNRSGKKTLRKSKEEKP